MSSLSSSVRASQADDAQQRSSLRDAHKALTRQRIVAALSELIREEHPLAVSMAAVAERAGVSEPTLYRYFPTKRDLFAALASAHHDHVASGIAPETPGQLAADVRRVYRRAAEVEPTVRWLLAAPDPEGVPRPNVQRRLELLRRALAGTLEALPPPDAEHLLRAVLLVTSPMAALYWKDYLGLDPDDAADTAEWMLAALTART